MRVSSKNYSRRTEFFESTLNFINIWFFLDVRLKLLSLKMLQLLQIASIILPIFVLPKHFSIFTHDNVVNKKSGYKPNIK